MAHQVDAPSQPRLTAPTEAWVWPLTAAIVFGGSILFWALAGMFWLATHPAERQVVIMMNPNAPTSERSAEAPATQASVSERGAQ